MVLFILEIQILTALLNGNIKTFINNIFIYTYTVHNYSLVHWRNVHRSHNITTEHIHILSWFIYFFIVDFFICNLLYVIYLNNVKKTEVIL